MANKSISELKQDYPLLQGWADHCATSIYKQIEEQQLIKEFLSTVDSEKTATQVKKQIGDGIIVVKTGESIDFEFTQKLTEEFLDKVNKIMDKFGWYPSFIGMGTINGGKFSTNYSLFLGKPHIEVHYEAKYDKEVTLLDRYLYHLTPDIKWKRIKHIGLTPKTQGKLANHPERIYLLTNLAGVDVERLAFTLVSHYKNVDMVSLMYLLKIDTTKLSNVKFFKDPNFWEDQAVWTYQNIPPTAISVEKTFKV